MLLNIPNITSVTEDVPATKETNVTDEINSAKEIMGDDDITEETMENTESDRKGYIVKWTYINSDDENEPSETETEVNDFAWKLSRPGTIRSIDDTE